MKKSVRNKNAYFTLAWSPIYPYDKYDAIRIVPELSGIIAVLKKTGNSYQHLFFYSCWRDGCRIALKKLMDHHNPKFPELLQGGEPEDLYYKYTVVDTNMHDMQDILFWLIEAYEPLYNEATFGDSGRYDSVSIKEITMKAGQVVEKFPGHPQT